LPSLWPLYLGGAVLLFLPLRRENLAVIAWILLYPLGASLMNENPSATRSFIGSPLAALLAGHAVSKFAWASRAIPFSTLRAAFLLPTGLLIALSIAKDLRPYLRFYFEEYPRISARGLDGFQY